MGKRTQRKISTPLSNWIRGKMKAKGLSRQQVLQQSGGGISKGYLGNILDNGRTNLTAPKMKALARGLDCRVSELAAVLGLDLSVELPPELIELADLIGQLNPKDRRHTQSLVKNITEYVRELLDKTNKNGTEHR